MTTVELELPFQPAGDQPAAIEALFAGAIDATYIGPNPAINGYVQSEGKDLRIIAGATSGGALLIVLTLVGLAVLDWRLTPAPLVALPPHAPTPRSPPQHATAGYAPF